VGVMMTGHGAINTAVEAMQAGALDYILKPFDLTVILPVLSRALTIRRLKMENAVLEKQVRLHVAELEGANRELEAFSYSVSHDLQAPLRHIDGYLKIYLEESEARLSERDKSLLGKIHASAEHMKELTEGLLNLSRLGRQPLSKKPIRLEELVGEVLNDLGKEQEKRKVAVRVGTLPECEGDPALIRQVYGNLLGNAFKFTRLTEKPVIEIGCVTRNGEQVYFVRDNGAGFDMQYAEKLFAAFQRLHSQEQFEGNGVGLSIVQRIIHRHGGRVWAEGESAKGATFYFTLPD
jgi:hypothetical protein